MNDKILLVIDDEPDILEVITIKLEHLGCEIKTAVTAEDGYDIIKKDLISCVLCDIILPGMSGVELIKKCREDNFNVPFIFYSGGSREQFMQDVLSYGAFDFVSKPELDDLEEAVLRSFNEPQKQSDDFKDKLIEFLGTERVKNNDRNRFSSLSSDFVLGIDSIDQQHNILVNIIDEIEQNIIVGNNGNLRAMKRLHLYLTEHLSYEEELFLKYSYPDREIHIQQHKNFKKMWELLKQALQQPKDVQVRILEKFKSYCLKHFLIYDKGYVDYLKERGVK